MTRLENFELVKRKIDEHKQQIGFWAEVGYRKWVRNVDNKNI